MFDTKQLRIAAASVPGRDHLRVGKNNQDAVALWRDRQRLVAVVADGCGSAPRAEVGAQLGARMLVQQLARRLEAGELDEPRDEAALIAWLESARQELLEPLRRLARDLAGSDELRATAEAVRDQLLFTLVGLCASPAGALLFALGDGALSLDGERIPLGPFPNNSPPYLGYALLPEKVHGFPEPTLHFRLVRRVDSFRALALGTDGALELFEHEPAESLLRDRPLFSNPDTLRRKLWLLAQGKSGPSLRDDTTLVLLRAAEDE